MVTCFCLSRKHPEGLDGGVLLALHCYLQIISSPFSHQTSGCFERSAISQYNLQPLLVVIFLSPFHSSYAKYFSNFISTTDPIITLNNLSFHVDNPSISLPRVALPFPQFQQSLPPGLLRNPSPSHPTPPVTFQALSLLSVVPLQKH